GHWSSKLNVAHAFTTNLGLGDLYATALTNNALVADTLVLTTLALPVTGWTEDTLTEKDVLFWLQGAGVNGLRLLDLALRPTANAVGGGQSNTKLVVEIYVEPVSSPFLSPTAEEVDWLLFSITSRPFLVLTHQEPIALVKRYRRKSPRHETR